MSNILYAMAADIYMQNSDGFVTESATIISICHIRSLQTMAFVKRHKSQKYEQLPVRGKTFTASFEKSLETLIERGWKLDGGVQEEEYDIECEFGAEDLRSFLNLMLKLTSTEESELMSTIVHMVRRAEEKGARGEIEFRSEPKEIATNSELLGSW